MRSGTHHPTPNGYKIFIPNPLPPKLVQEFEIPPLSDDLPTVDLVFPDRPFDLPLILDVHAHTVNPDGWGDHLDPGKLRDSRVWVGAPGGTIQEADFVPPPPKSLPGHLDHLVTFCQSSSLPPLIIAALLHAQFESIHPFHFANGRTGRTLISYLLASRGLPPIDYATLLNSEKETYWRLIHAVQTGDAWEAWITFFLSLGASD